LPAFRDAEVVTGASQLDRVVTWVHISEVLNVWRFLSGGELLLSTGLELARAEPEARVSYLRSLAKADVRALGIELIQWLHELPPEVPEAAEALNLPIIVFRTEVSFAELTRAAHERILRPHIEGPDEPVLDSLIDALVETGRDSRFLHNQLGAVLALPGRARSTLLSTLQALLDSRFNIAEAARRLGVRRQSIYYRLDQLNGLLGTLDDPERQLAMLVALALLRRAGG
jgi:purine catabolism regulator